MDKGRKGKKTDENAGEMWDMNEENINKIIAMNQQLLLLLGYARGILMTVDAYIDRDKIKWLDKCIENIVYLDKPLIPYPKD